MHFFSMLLLKKIKDYIAFFLAQSAPMPIAIFYKQYLAKQTLWTNQNGQPIMLREDQYLWIASDNLPGSIP
jgi:hypothetical protein